MAAVGKVVQVIGQAVLHGIDGSVKSIYPGDIVSIGDVIETMSGSKVILQLANGREISIGANEQLAIDDSLVASFDDLAMNADDLQNALENGEQLTDEEEETAAGEETGQGILLNDILEGDTSEGYVGSYLLPSGNITDTTDTGTYGATGNNNNDTTTATEVTGSPVYSIADGATVPPGFVLNPDGTYYVDPTLPDYDYLGEGEDVSYDVDIVITYPDGTTENGSVNVVVVGTNDAPVAYAEIINAVEDGPVVTGQLTATDPDVNDTLTFEVDSPNVPEGFTLNADGTYSFDPSSYDYLAEGEQQILTIDYKVTDSAGEVSYESITITITGVNDAPVVSDISFSANEDTSIIISAAELLAQATDVDGDNLSIAGITSVTGGTLVDNGDGTYTFTPDKDFNGEATFEFSVTDGRETVSATARIDVAPVNDAPVAADAIVETTEDTVLTGTLPAASDIDADAVTYALDKDASHGSVVVNADGTYTYTPAENYNGEDSFTYTVSDGKGGTNTYNVGITVAPVNDAPTAANTTIETDEDTVVTGTLPAAADIDGDDVTYSLDTDAGHGTVVVNADGTYSYTPADNYNGDDSFSYTVSDGKGGTNTYNVGITVAPVNDAPTAANTTVTTDEDTVVTGTLPAAADIDGDDVTYSLDTDAAHGTVTVNADGTYTYTPADNYNGDDSFSYTVSDGKGGTNTYNVAITVAPVNDAPTAANTTVTTDEDTVVTGTLPAAADIDGDDVTYSLDTDAAHGTVVVNADGTYTYTPADNYNGDDSFSYTVSDGKGGTNTYNVAITVAPVNDAPTAANTTIETDEDTVVTGTLPAAADIDGDDVTYSLDTDAAHGTVTVNADGTYTYTPADNYNGDDSFSYTVSDGKGGTNTYNVAITVAPVNDAPTAANTTVTTDEDTVVTGTLPAAADIDGDDVTYSLDTDAAHGTVVVNADGTYTYTPADNYNGDDSFSYTVSDGKGGTNTYNVAITVAPVNDAPTAANTTVTTDEDTVVTGTLPAAADIDGDDVTYSLDTDAAHGTVTVNADGTYTYTPADNYNGDDSFSYTVSDGKGGTNTYNVGITVAPVNDAPAAANTTIETDEDTVVSGTLPVAEDIDGDDVTYSLDTDAAHGTVTVNADGTYTYTPADNYNGDDSFSYTVSDGKGGTNTYNVAITVAPVNDAPTAADTTITTDEDTVVTGTLPVAEDIDGDDVTYSLDTDAAHGTVTVNADGTYTYTPADNYNGDDSFSYTVSDGKGGTNTYNVGITVAPVNDAPTAANTTVTTDEDTVVTGTLPAAADIDGDDVTYSLDTDAAHGTVVVNADGTYTYTPADNYNGDDSFSYTVSDGKGGTNTYNVGITVAPVNDAPTAANTTATTDEDTVVTGTLPVAEDIDGDDVTYSLDTDAAHGTVTVNADGTYTYTPVDNYNGDDSFSYTVSDGKGGTNTYNVAITVAPVNDAPTAANTTIETDEDTVVTGTLPAAADIDGDDVTYSLDTDAAHGTVVVNADGTYTYTPADNYNGDDSFSYTVSDGKGGTNTYNVAITVAPVNDAPTAANTTIETDEDTVVTGTLPAAADIDGDDVTYSLDTDAAHGTVVVNADGTYTYTPADNYNGDDSFSYTVSDGKGGTNTYNVGITVAPVNDAPTAADTTVTTDEDTVVTGTLPVAADIDGDDVTYSLDTDAAHGTVVVNADGTYTYTPADNYNGDDSFSYTVSDGKGGTNTYNVGITVAPVNDAPTAANTTIETDEDTVVSGTLPVAEDIDGDDVTYSLDTDAAHGTVTVNADGTYTYTPADNYNGDDSFSYTVSDGKGGTNTYNVAITVAPVNDAPTAANTTIETDEDTVVTGTLPATADIDGDDVTYSLDTDAAHGTVVVNADGTYTYTPADNYNGDDSFSYTVSDGKGGTNTYNVGITVAPVNDAPTAANTTIETDEDTVVTGTLPAAADIDGDDVTYSLDTDAAHGTVTVNADGTYTYTPADNYNGDDSFSYTVSDGKGGTNTYEVAITVAPVNDAPTAANTTVTTDEDTVVTGTLPAAADIDGDDVTYSLDTDAAHGTVVVNADGTYTYTPADNYNGDDSFSYTVSDGKGGTNTYNVAITVAPVNDAPTAANTTVTTDEDTVVTGTLPVAEDIDGDDVTYSLDTDAAHGSVVVNADGTYTYTPADNYNGDDSFSYTVSDGKGGTNTYNVAITVAPVNDAPIAGEVKSESLYEDTILTGSLTATDADGDSLTFAVVGDSPKGFTLNNDGTYTFDANSYDSLAKDETADFEIRYTVSDGKGGTTESVLNIQVIGTNDAPVANEVGIGAVENKVGSGVSLIATDVDSTDLTFAISEGQDLPVGFKFDAATNMVSIDASTGYDYLEKGQKETFRVEYTVTDGEGATSVSYINITVSGSADKPVVVVDNNVTDVTFVSDGGSYTNALGIYTTDEDGNPVAGELILLNSDKAAVDELLATYRGEDVKFFIVTNVGSNFAGGEVSFSIDADGNPTLLLDGSATGKNVFYSDESLNADGIDHFVTNADGSIGIEDLFYGLGGYDGDFNDLVINVTERPLVYTENEGSVYVFSNISVTDVDSTEAIQMKVYMSSFYSSEDRITVDEDKLPEGITYTISNGTVTFSSTEALPFSVYEEAAKAVMYENTSDTPRTDDRVFNIRVMDASGTYSDPVSVTMQVVDVVETYDPPVAVDDFATVTEVNPVMITGDATVTEKTISVGANDDITPEAKGFDEPRVIVPDPNNQNATVGGEYVLINSVSSNFALSNTSNASSYIEIGDVARGIQVNVNLSGGDDVVYLTGTNSGSVNINGGELSGGNDHDIVVLPGSASDYIFVVNGNEVQIGSSGDLSAYNADISVYSKDGSFTGTIVLNNIEEIRFGGYSETVTEYVVDVETSQTLTDDGYVILSVANGTLSAGTDNGDGTWTVDAEDIEGLKIIPNGAGTPDVAVAEVHDPGYVTDISASVAQGNLITNDYDVDTSVENLHITKVDGTTVASTGETEVKGEYGTLYIKEDGTYRYELDNDSTKLDTVNKGDVVTEEFKYTLSDGTNEVEAKLTVTVNGADDVSISAGNIIISEGHTSVPVANLLFMIDVSGSMGDKITSDGDSRLDVLKVALNDLIAKYDAKGDIGGVQIVTFSTYATAISKGNSFWLSAEQAKTVINNLNSNGWTDYDDAIAKLQATYDSTTPPSADYTHAYFVSDGAPTLGNYVNKSEAEISNSEANVWRNWLDGTSIDEVYAVGIGSGTDSAQLSIVAWSDTNTNYADNVMVVPDDDLQADISAAAEKNSRESSVFNDVDIPENLTAHLTTVTYAGQEYQFSESVTEYTIDLGNNGSVIIHSDGSYVFNAGMDVDQDVTSLLKYTFDVNGEDYAGTLSLTTNHIVDNLDINMSTSGGSIYESSNGYGVGTNGIGKGESLTFTFDDDDVATTAKFDITGTVKSGSGYTVYDTEGHSTYYSMPTSGGEIVITNESGISHVVFNGNSSSTYYVQPVSAEATVGHDNVFAVFGDANSNDLDFSGLKDLDAIQMNNDSKAQTVTLSASDVLDISDSTTHTLQISGGEGDKLVLSGDWKAVGNNTYCADINGNEVCIEVNNDDHKLKVFTDDGNQIG